MYDTINWLKHVKSLDERKFARQNLAKTLHGQSELCRKKAKLDSGVDLAVPYGQNMHDGHGLEAFDWFAPFHIPEETQHVLVYIHGGYWKALDLPESSHWATSVTDFGGIYVGLAYRLAPWQTIQTMPERICYGLKTVFEHSHERISEKTKVSPNIQMHLVGHSAGAQLVIESIAREIRQCKQNGQQEHEAGVNKLWLDSVRSLILLSGIYDLRPLINTSINQSLKIENTQQAWRLSPLSLFAEPDPVIHFPTTIRWLIAWTEFDSPAIIGQSHQMIALLRSYYRQNDGNSKSKSACCEDCVDTFCIAQEDHFSSIEKLYAGVSNCSFLKKLFDFIHM
ncbi:hypothetical protein FBUS_08604 [Fasciolopsis buskii]|uniref:Alpha/beta hydrolase fold-3 domain-containing protein n=1 Tax=Fasciolopsis buskii TaxID=27845 RepID=A0A8E0VPT7_9TREM|nr:hypothetical protein FBUS_08604 [Fasciolopsis buski]